MLICISKIETFNLLISFLFFLLPFCITFPKSMSDARILGGNVIFSLRESRDSTTLEKVRTYFRAACLGAFGNDKAEGCMTLTELTKGREYNVEFPTTCEHITMPRQIVKFLQLFRFLLQENIREEFILDGVTEMAMIDIDSDMYFITATEEKGITLFNTDDEGNPWHANHSWLHSSYEEKAVPNLDVKKEEE